MKPGIPLVGKYFLTSDSYNWKVSYIIRQKNRQTKEMEDAWKNVSYHSTIRSTVQSLARELLREAECNTLAELKETAESIATELSDAIQHIDDIDQIIHMIGRK